MGDSGIGVPCLQTKARKYALCAANTLQIDGHADSSKGGNTYLAGLPRDGGARVGFCGGPMATLGDIDKG